MSVIGFNTENGVEKYDFHSLDNLPSVSPEVFGAVGDGVIDDTESLLKVITAKEVIDLYGKSYVITSTLELHSVMRNGILIYKGDINQPVISLKDGSGLIDMTIIIAVENYASSVVLADYTSYDTQWSPMKWTLNGLYIDNTICTVFVEGSSCIKITYDKYKVIGGQHISNVRFSGLMDYGIHIEPILRNEQDNPVYNSAIFSNIGFESCNTALKVYPKMLSGEVENAQGGIGLMLLKFTNENHDLQVKPFFDLHNTSITGDMIIPWDYYGEYIPEQGTYRMHNSKVNVNTAYFMRGNHTDDVRYGWFYDGGTGEYYTNRNVIKPENIGDRFPLRPIGGNWSVDTIKAVRFKPENYSYECLGFEMSYNNGTDPTGRRTIQFGFDIAGKMIWRGYDPSNGAWSDIHYIYADGSKPTSYSGKRPDGLKEGDFRFDLTYMRPIWWTGEKWVFAGGEQLSKNVVYALTTDLENYYKKSETYSREEINALVSAIPKFSIQPVDSLPTENISTTTVYLLKSGEESSNLYTEYIYVNGVWEYLGTQTVDLSGYALKTEIVSTETIQNMIDTKFNSITNGNEVAY